MSIQENTPTIERMKDRKKVSVIRNLNKVTFSHQ